MKSASVTTLTQWPPPVDLYGLGLLRLVAKHGNITRAARDAGLTQSALTRQVQGMEARLGVALFDRTTRNISLTQLGAAFLKETAEIPAVLQSAIARLTGAETDTPKTVRIGVGRCVALGHLPGLLHAHVRRAPEVRTQVEHLAEAALLAKLTAGELDVAVLCPPARLPGELRITHRMADGFHLVIPAAMPLPTFSLKSKTWTARLQRWLEQQSWILLQSQESSTGARLCKWLRSQGLSILPTMEPDNFDLMVHLVALGLGVSIVPRRAIAAFPRRQLLRRLPLPTEFARELAVVVPRSGKPPAHVAQFVDNILFS
jgi:DNA-binding transcriptional LysR family regulator